MDKPRTIVNMILKSGKEFEIATDGDAKLLYSLINSLLRNGDNEWIAFPQNENEPLLQIRASEIAAVTFFEVEP